MAWTKKPIIFIFFIFILVLTGLIFSPVLFKNQVKGGSLQTSVVIYICGNGTIEEPEICDIQPVMVGHLIAEMELFKQNMEKNVTMVIMFLVMVVVLFVRPRRLLHQLVVVVAEEEEDIFLQKKLKLLLKAKPILKLRLLYCKTERL